MYEQIRDFSVGFTHSFFTAAIGGAVVLWWLARKEHGEVSNDYFQRGSTCQF